MSDWNNVVFNWYTIANIEECNNALPPLNTWVKVKFQNDSPYIASLRPPQDYGEEKGRWTDYHWYVQIPKRLQAGYMLVESFTHWRHITAKEHDG